MQRLLRARDRGFAAFDRLVVVDHNPRCKVRSIADPQIEFVTRDWLPFLIDFLPQADARDCLISTPFAPHLLAEYLARTCRLTASFERPDLRLGTPYESVRSTGTLCASHAEWICPVTCIEPPGCPKIRWPRWWDMERTVRDNARGYVPIVFKSAHLTYGVSGLRMGDVLRETRRFRGPGRFLVATVSACHGAVNVITVTKGEEHEKS